MNPKDKLFLFFSLILLTIVSLIVGYDYYKTTHPPEITETVASNKEPISDTLYSQYQYDSLLQITDTATFLKELKSIVHLHNTDSTMDISKADKIKTLMNHREELIANDKSLDGLKPLWLTLDDLHSMQKVTIKDTILNKRILDNVSSLIKHRLKEVEDEIASIK